MLASHVAESVLFGALVLLVVLTPQEIGGLLECRILERIVVLS